MVRWYSSLGGGRPPPQPGDHVLQGGPVDGVVHVLGRVEVAGPQRPVPYVSLAATGLARDVRRIGPRQPSSRADTVRSAVGLPVAALEVLAQRPGQSGGQVDGRPDGHRLDQVTARPGHRGGALRPARAGRRAERAQLEPLPEPRVGPGRHRAAAQQPPVGGLPAGGGHVVFGDVLQVTRQRVEAEDPRGRDVGTADRPAAGRKDPGRPGRQPNGAGPSLSAAGRSRRGAGEVSCTSTLFPIATAPVRPPSDPLATLWVDDFDS